MSPTGRRGKQAAQSLTPEYIELCQELKNLDQERNSRILAQRNLLTYASSIEIPGAPVTDEEECEFFKPIETKFAKHHLLWIDCLQRVEDGEIQRLLGLWPPGTAKALALDTPIPTPSGWTTMGALRVGDDVFDERGAVCQVTWKSPVWLSRPVYRVITDCGNVIVADEEHEWPVRLDGKKPIVRNKTTKFLASKARSKRPMLHRAAALELPHASLPIDPYVLGFWLGDGTSALPQLTIGEADAVWSVGELRRLGCDIRPNKGPTRYHLHGMRSRFVALGLLNDPAHRTFGKKYIPAVYMRSSREQRLSLLQGLIDTDGSVEANGCVCFTSTLVGLSEGVAELVRSLGAKASVVQSRAMLNGKDCGPIWRVYFLLKNAARMPRKAVRTRNGARTTNTYLSFEPAGIADTVCIEVSSSSHLFLCGRSMSPTHNSTYSSVVFPTHFMGRFAGSQIILANYGSDLPRKWGRKARSIVKQAAYQRIFDTSISEESAAADEWALKSGSEFMGGGILSGITGNRADGIVWDDLIKGREQADSKVIRDKTYDEYLESLLSRKKPHAWEVGVTTRWHEDDPAGRILPKDYNGESGWIDCRDGNRWYVVCIPAEADRADDILGRKIGERIWPEWFPEHHFDTFKRNPRTWNALYQQRPAPEEGSYFLREWIRTYDEAPPLRNMHIYGASDYAVTADDGDWTVHIVVGVDPSDNMYVLDFWRGQTTPDVWCGIFCDLVLKWKPIEWAEESGQIASSVGPFLSREILERKAFVYRRKFPTRGDKAVRAQSIRGRMAARGLYIPVNAPWRAEFERELLVFPASTHDDQVDALGLIGQLLAHVTAGKVPIEKKVVPKELIYEVDDHGIMRGNMSIMTRVMQKQRAKERL